MRKLAFIFLVCLFTSATAQQMTLRVLDAETGEPIPYATIVTGPGSGTISNEEGFFTLSAGTLKGDALKISCMGYRTLEVSPAELSTTGPLIRLHPAAINLNEVSLTNRVPGVDEIMEEVRRRLQVNYPYSGNTYRIFYRESEYMKFDELQLELEKASDLDRESLKQADARLGQLGRDIVRSNTRKFLDFNGLYGIASDTATILRVEGATELTDHERGYSMDDIQERAKNIILDHLDSSQTYKVKTGIFKIEDSISPALEISADESADSDSTELSYLKGKTRGLAKIASWEPGTRLRNFIDPEKYRHEFLEATYFDGNYVYAVSFAPRRHKSKFAGMLYIDAASYAVLKADYAYGRGRRGDKVNLKLLLGIKYVENLSRGTVIFKREESGLYKPYFIQKEYGNYIYLHRNLKFIENSRQKKKVRFDFLMEGGVRQRESILMSPAGPGETESLISFEEPEKVRLRKIDQYEPGIWGDSQIIEPLEEMKNFRVRAAD